jgi:hypothetical protein
LLKAKVFESCVGALIDSKLVFHNNQFGVTKNGGCGKALFAFRSIVDYFRCKNSNVYLCSMDLAKAFDKIDRVSLLEAMHKRFFNTNLIRTFASWLDKLNGVISWNGQLSSLFVIGSGVPQGSFLGGKFFNLVMDCVLYELEERGLGCHIDGVFAGALAYADDLILLSPSIMCIQGMLNICVKIFSGFGLNFNADMCVTAVCGRTLSTPLCLTIYSTELPWVTEMCYLGIMFHIGAFLSVDVTNRVQKFMAAVSTVLRGRVNGFEDVYTNMIKTTCMPFFFYGLDFMHLDDQSVNKLSVI